LGVNSIVFHPGRFQQPVPRVFRTEFYCEAEYKIPISTATITQGSVKANSLFAPFRPGGSSAFPSFTFVGPATETSLRPTGFTDLTQGNLYQSIKTIRSDIAVRWNGSNSGNNCMAVLVPSLDTNLPTSIFQARTMPFMKEGTFSVSKPNTNCDKAGWLRHSVNPMTVYGLTPLEFKADVTANVTTPTTDAAIGVWWTLILQTNDEDVTSTSASTLQVRLHWIVEMYQMESMALS